MSFLQWNWCPIYYRHFFYDADFIGRLSHVGRPTFIVVFPWERYYFLWDCCCRTRKVLDIFPQGKELGGIQMKGNPDPLKAGRIHYVFRGSRRESRRESCRGKDRDRVQGNSLQGRISYPLFLLHSSRRWISEEQQMWEGRRSWPQSGPVLCSEIKQEYTCVYMKRTRADISTGGIRGSTDMSTEG